MVRRYRPHTYLEIGSGITTCFAYRAIRDVGSDTQIVSIDPEPRTSIDAICTNVIRDGLETCHTTIFEDLVANDILFDGSHRSFINSDVTVFFIDILPRLQPGVIVHHARYNAAVPTTLTHSSNGIGMSSICSRYI